MNREQVTSTVQPITAAQTHALRHALLWPDQPLAYVQLPEDAAGQHFGAFVAGELRAVISLFVAPNGEARFRKFATDPAWQGRGLGTALLRHTMQAARARGAHAVVRCPAKRPAVLRPLWPGARGRRFLQRHYSVPAAKLRAVSELNYLE